MAGVGRDNPAMMTKDSPSNDGDEPTKVSKVSNDLSKKKELFQRLVKEILANFNPSYRIRETAIMALQEASECVVKNTFEIRKLLGIHGNRITIQPKDIQLARRIGGKL